jgi:hypothetical protein
MTPTTPRFHFAISLVTFDNAIAYSGRGGRAVVIRDLEVAPMP